MVFRLYLSPSDQHGNVGSYPKGTSEKYWNRIIADQTAAFFRQIPGVEVRIGADTNPSVDEYAARVGDSDRWGSNLHVCFHTNAGQGGTMLCVYPSAESRKLGAKLLARIAPLTPGADPGLVDRPDLYELNATKAVAALIEFDRHDTAAGVAVIRAHIADGSFARATAQGICDYTGLKMPVAKPVVVAPVAKPVVMVPAVLPRPVVPTPVVPTPVKDAAMTTFTPEQIAAIVAAATAFNGGVSRAGDKYAGPTGKVSLVQEIADAKTIAMRVEASLIALSAQMDRIDAALKTQPVR